VGEKKGTLGQNRKNSKIGNSKRGNFGKIK
jgi:hypothetical protein